MLLLGAEEGSFHLATKIFSFTVLTKGAPKSAPEDTPVLILASVPLLGCSLDLYPQHVPFPKHPPNFKILGAQHHLGDCFADLQLLLLLLLSR